MGRVAVNGVDGVYRFWAVRRGDGSTPEIGRGLYVVGGRLDFIGEVIF
jgi:hypothetical protein